MDDPRITLITTSASDPAWLVAGYEAVRALFGDPRLGRSHPDPQNAPRISVASPVAGPSGDAETEGADHARMRRVLGKAFAARRMERLRSRVQARVETLLDELTARTPPADLHEAFSFPLPALVIAELLGVPSADCEAFRGWSEDMASMHDADRAQAGMAAMAGYMRGLVEQKRQRPGEDVISDLVVAADQRAELSTAEIVRHAITLLFAGHVTTAMAIDKGLVLLETHPEQREALWRDPSLAAGAVEEILRAPFPAADDARWQAGGTPRYANADIGLGGVTIRAGDLVLLGRPAANQDERIYLDPDRFDIGRGGPPHLAFGHGPHFCLGAPLARIELQSVFTTVPRRLPTLRLAVPVEQLKRRTDLLFGKLVELPVTW